MIISILCRKYKVLLKQVNSPEYVLFRPEQEISSFDRRDFRNSTPIFMPHLELGNFEALHKKGQWIQRLNTCFTWLIAQ